MRKAILVLALIAVAASPAHAERFAISCSGSDSTAILGPGGRQITDPQTQPLIDIVYVIDEEAQTVERFIPAQRKLDNVCGLPGLTCDKRFSATRITLGGETAQGYRTVIGFDWDRQTNRVETIFDMFGANGSGVKAHWSLQCEPAAIPAL